MTGALLTLVVVGVALTLLARWRGLAWLIWLAKPAASTGFVALALHRGALDTVYGRILLIALCLCWLGDVLLIGHHLAMLAAGLLAFLLGHAALATAFAGLGWNLPALLGAGAVMSGVAAAVLRWVWPHVPGRMRVPVVAYVVVISGMTALAAGASAATGRHLLVVAATCFFVSDIAVARERFVHPSLVNRLWGLPLYYLAVVLLALSVAPAPA